MEKYANLTVVVSLVAFAFGLSTVVTFLNSFWRSEKHLKRFILLLIFSVLVVVVRRAMSVVGYFQADMFYSALQYFDFFSSLFLLLASVELFKIIKSMDNEEPEAFKEKRRAK